MIKQLNTLIVILLSLHGLIHLMGFVAYWPLGEVPELAYKTIFLGGRLEFGTDGTRLYSLLWLVTAVGFVISAVALLTEQSWAVPLLVGITLVSILITTLDWSVAFRGTLINIAVLLIIGFGPQLSKLLTSVLEQQHA